MTVRPPESDFLNVRNLELFSGIADDQFETLMRGAYVQNFPPQVELITEGDPSDFLHIVVSGTVDLYASWNNRETSIGTVHPVSTFILAATINSAPYLMSARTMEKSRIVLVPSQDVRSAFAKDSYFARAIVKELARAFRRTIKCQKDLKLRSSLERVANYILRQQDRNDGEMEFRLPCEKRRLASFLGMTPENLSRAFRALEKHGVVVGGSNICISDRRALIDFAKPDPLIDDLSI